MTLQINQKYLTANRAKVNPVDAGVFSCADNSILITSIEYGKRCSGLYQDRISEQAYLFRFINSF